MKLTDELYKIVEQENNHITILLSNKEHVIFKAHFPSHPILPGFIQVDIAQELLQQTFTKLKKIKFLQPVLPSTLLTYQFAKNKVSIYHEQIKVSEFLYE